MPFHYGLVRILGPLGGVEPPLPEYETGVSPRSSGVVFMAALESFDLSTSARQADVIPFHHRAMRPVIVGLFRAEFGPHRIA